MRKKYLVGVDLGTSATKAALYSPEGTLVAEASAEVPLHYPAPGIVEQENDEFYTTAAETVSQCLGSSNVDPHQVAAIGFDSQMAGIGSVDESFRPATRFDSWLDMRCQPYIDQLEKNHGELITRLTGCPPICDHGPKILWWKEERPEAYDRIAKFVTPAGYVAGRMAGLKADQAFMDYTFIHFSALCDAKAGSWSHELCSLLGVDPHKLPKIVPPWEVIGEATSVAARDFGLEPGTPIVAGAGDTAASALGAGTVRSGMLFDVAGTASVLAGCTDQFAPDAEGRVLLVMRSVVGDLWHPLAYVGGGGLALRWFRDEFFQPAREFEDAAGEDTARYDAYDLMGMAASRVSPGADGLFFSPHLGGRICPADPQMRGAWAGFSWGHTQAHFIRAILESIAFEYAFYLRVLSDLVPDLDFVEARVIGGGAQSRYWNQIKADVLDVPYQRLKRSEFATWGSALVAGYAVGLFDNLADSAEVHAERNGEALPPQRDAVRIYEEITEQYIEWQKTLGRRGIANATAR